jgi:hypothetical protein
VRADEEPASAAIVAPTGALPAATVPAEAASASTAGEAAAAPVQAVPAAAPQEMPSRAEDLAAIAAEHADTAARGTDLPPPEGVPASPHPSPVKAHAGFASPREACAGRTEFSLYRCMRTQCAKPPWNVHEQCVRLRQTDQVH